MDNTRRSPHGERGLKLTMAQTATAHKLSLPLRGAWIEINTWRCACRYRMVAPLTGSVD